MFDCVIEECHSCSLNAAPTFVAIVYQIFAEIRSLSIITCTVLLNEVQSRHSSLRLAEFCSPVFAGLGLRNLPDAYLSDATGFH